MLKNIRTDCITPQLNKFKMDCNKESKKNPQTYDFEQKRYQYCKLLFDLYEDELNKNNIETLRDRQYRLLYYMESRNSILVGVGGGIGVGMILSVFPDIFDTNNPNYMVLVTMLLIKFMVLAIFTIWISFNLSDAVIGGYKFENMFGTVSWEIKFLEEKLIDKTQETIEAVRLKNTVDDENSETITDNEEELAEALNEQDDNVRL